MNETRKPGSPHAAARRPIEGRAILLLALLFLGVMVVAPSLHAQTRNSDVKAGVAAFDAGAFGVARQDLQPLAEKGNAEAAFWLGRMYEDGLGVKKNVSTAVTWYTKAAKAGWVHAKVRLGEIYLNGTEELQDFKKARTWLESAAYDGDRRAERDLGRIYANGWGTDKDPVWAYVWYEMATRQGDDEAKRQRDALLKTMPADTITEAQSLAEDTAPTVFGEVHGHTQVAKQTPAKTAAKSAASTSTGQAPGSGGRNQ